MRMLPTLSTVRRRRRLRPRSRCGSIQLKQLNFGMSPSFLQSSSSPSSFSSALWSKTLARPFPHSLTPLTRLLALDCSPHSRPPLRSLVRSLAHFAHSLTRGTVNAYLRFFSIFDHSTVSEYMYGRNGPSGRELYG